jgi:Flp pilus assembly protein CpaB
MKSKNVVLMAIAVGCGLVAAYVTARLSAKGNEETVTVLVAGDQLEQGAVIKIDDKGESKQLAWKQFPKGSEPASFINDAKALNGKRLNKTLRKGDHFTEGDLTNNQGMALPKGRTARAIKVSAESCVGGLILPGSRVHVVLSETVSNGAKRSAIIMKDMLVVAVNAETNRPEDQNSFKQVTTITLAVTPKQGTQLSLAEKRGDLTILLCDNLTKEQAAAADEVKPEDITFEPITELPCDKKETAKAEPPPAPAAPPTVDLWVARLDLPAGTKFDDLKDYLEKVQVAKVPDNAINDDSALKGQTLTKPVYKNSFVPKAALEGQVEVVAVPPTPAPEKQPDKQPEKQPEKPAEKAIVAAAPPPPVRHLRELVIANGPNIQQFTIDMDVHKVLTDGGRATASTTDGK